MSTTLSQLQTRMSLRLGEDSVPSGNEYTRRTQFFNEAGKSIVRKHYWWWTEASTSFNSVANQTSYTSTDGFPSNIRGSSVLELRYNGTLYTPVQQTEAFNLTNSDYSGLSENYFIFNKTLYPVSPFGDSIVNGVTMKYYKVWTTLSNNSDVVDVPDDFADLLVAFALARVFSIDSERGSAADNFDEFNEIYKEMEMEQNNYLFALKSSQSDTVALFE